MTLRTREKGEVGCPNEACSTRIVERFENSVGRAARFSRTLFSLLAAIGFLACDSQEPEPLEILMDLAGFEREEGLLLTTVPTERIVGQLDVITHSFGDLNGDGRTDAVIPGSAPGVWINQGDYFERIPLESAPEPSPLFYSASAVMDVTGDEVPDILLAGVGGLEVWERQGRQYSRTHHKVLDDDAVPTSLVVIPDYDDDGYPDGLLVFQNYWPQVGAAVQTLAAGTAQQLGPFEYPGGKGGKSHLFRLGPEGLLEQDLAEVMDDAMLFCVNGPTWTGSWLTGRPFGLSDMLFVGNASVSDCVLEYESESGKFVEAVPGVLSTGEEGGRFATMGFDYLIGEEGYEIVLSDVHPNGVRQVSLPFGGKTCALPSATHKWPGESTLEIGWGVLMEDEWMVVSRSNLRFPAELQETYDAALGGYVGEGGVSLYTRNRDGVYAWSGSLLSDALQQSSSYHVNGGDWFGGNGEGDGCPDALISSLFPHLDTENVQAAIGNAQFLASACSGEFVGIRFEANPKHVGSLVTVEMESGRILRKAMRHHGGVGGSRDPRVSIRLRDGDDGDIVAKVSVDFPNGTRRAWKSPPRNQYLPLDSENWVSEPFVEWEVAIEQEDSPCPVVY